MSRKRIYLDYAATTPLDPRVERVMQPFLRKQFGNPSSIHAEGAAAKKAVDVARIDVALSLEAHADEIVFTSGGTEANNLAIFGTIAEYTKLRELQTPISAKKNFHRSVHIVATNIEHSSVLEPLRELERRGVSVTYVPVEPSGIVKPERIIAAIRPNTALVSVMYANNEIGTIQPIRKIGRMIHDSRLRPPRRTSGGQARIKIHASPHGKTSPFFHVDACQAPLYLNCLVNALGVDLMTLDGHKMYGPKGVGCLYVRRGTPLSPTMAGGGQERGLRATTENVPGIVGFAEALRIACVEREKESNRLSGLRDHFYSDVLENIRIEMMREIILNGSMKAEERLPNNLNISLPGVDTEFLTLALDAAGVAVSTKSSCLGGERESYVVNALGGGAERARATLRFTLGRRTTKRDLDRALRALTLALRP